MLGVVDVYWVVFDRVYFVFLVVVGDEVVVGVVDYGWVYFFY